MKLQTRVMALLATCSLVNTALAFESPQALQDAFLAAMRANDVTGMAACYTADAINYTPDIMVGIGPDSVHESWGSFLESFRITNVELSDGHLEISGDLAAAWGLFHLLVEPKDGGEAFEVNGRYTDVAKKIDGSWLYVLDHASLPQTADEE